MFADLELTGLEFDPSVLEAYVGACLAVAGVVIAFNKLSGTSPYGTGRVTRGEREHKRPSPPPAAATADRCDDESAAAPEVVDAAAADEPPAPAEVAPREKRQSLRRRGKPVKVLLSDPDGGESPLRCWVIDRSRGGLGLIAPRPLPVGAVVDLRAAHAPEDLPPLQVEVRNCRRRGHRWHAGCRFTSDLPWSVLLLFG